MSWNPFSRKPKETPDMRGMWLSKMPAPQGIPRDTVFATVIDFMPGNRGVTLCCAYDGTTSLLNTAGGGTIGAGQASKDVAQAAQQAVRTLHALRGLLAPVTSTPLPQAGSFAFHALTSDGVRRAEAADQDLQSESHPLHQAFLAFHGVITQLRMHEEQTDRR
jgi:hypothetical protein